MLYFPSLKVAFDSVCFSRFGSVLLLSSPTAKAFEVSVEDLMGISSKSK
jgi:hypothetical protein